MPKPKKPKQQISEQKIPEGVPWTKECTSCHHQYDVGMGCCPVCCNPEFSVVKGFDELDAVERIAASLDGYDWRAVPLGG